MKHPGFKVSCIFAIIIAGAGCSGPLTPNSVSTGKGELRLSINPASRTTTVLPSTVSSAASYKILLTSGPAPDIVSTKTNLSSPLLLDPGTWTLVVDAFDASSNEIGASSPQTLTISPSIQTSINVQIYPLRTAGGTGQVHMTWTWPAADVTATTVALYAWNAANPPGTPVSLAVGAFAPDYSAGQGSLSTSLPSGTYFLVLHLNKNSATHPPVSCIVQVYDNRISSAAITLDAGVLSQPPAAPTQLVETSKTSPGGSFVLGWTSNSAVEGGYTLYTNGVSQSIPAGSGSQAITTPPSIATTYEIRAYNAFGESAAGSATYTFTPFSISYATNFPGASTSSGAAPIDSTTYEAGVDKPVIAGQGSMSVTGYAFVGWNTLANGSGTSYFAGPAATSPTGNLRLYAQWSNLPTYSVTYNANGGSGAPIDTNNYLQGAMITAATSGTMAYPGYAFAGWNTAANGTGTAYSPGATFAIGSVGVRLYAQWSLATYSLSYALNGGTNNSLNPTSYAITTPTITLAAPTRTNYLFAGWYSDAGFTTAVTQIPIGSTGNLTFYAKWTGIGTINVTFQSNPVTPYTVSFSPTLVSVQQAASVILTCSDATLAASGTGWQWSIDGTPVSGATASSFTYTPASYLPIVGQHLIYLKVLYNGVWYSGNIFATVTY